MATTTKYGISSTIGVHLTESISIEAKTAGADGSTKWLEICLVGMAPLGDLTVNIHAGQNLPLWAQLQDLADAWRDSQKKPEPDDGEDDAPDALAVSADEAEWQDDVRAATPGDNAEYDRRYGSDEKELL